jgi:hypothetical protein
MQRRDFLKLTPAAAGATATLTLTEPGHEPEPFDVRVLRLQPGDVVIFTAPGTISRETAERLTTYAEAHLLPAGVKAAVMGDGLTVAGVLRGGHTGGRGADLPGGKG